MEHPWNTHGKPLETPREDYAPMEDPWESDGIPLEFSGRTHGPVYCSINPYQRLIADPQWTLADPSVIRAMGNPWTSSLNPWETVGYPGANTVIP